MSTDQLDLAARAAGFAMVNPDDTITFPSRRDTADRFRSAAGTMRDLSPSIEPQQLMITASDDAKTKTSSFGQEWLGFLTRRAVTG